MIKLDYSLDTPEERNELVKQILEENPNPGEKYLEILTDYLIFCMEKQEKKQKKILTDNRMTTVNKRETSFEGLAEKFENGEDGVYNIMTKNKHQLLQPKQKITQWDIDNMPGMRGTVEAIDYWKRIIPKVEGKDKYIAKRSLIEFRKQQYLIKSDYICQSKTTPTYERYSIDLPCEE